MLKPEVTWSDDDHALTDQMRAALAGDKHLATMVRDALRALAATDPAYVVPFNGCPGVRLAGMVNGGLVESATERGRRALEDAYVKVRAAGRAAPGMDTNDLMDHVTGRANPRTAHLTDDREPDADREDRQALNRKPLTYTR